MKTPACEVLNFAHIRDTVTYALVFYLAFYVHPWQKWTYLQVLNISLATRLLLLLRRSKQLIFGIAIQSIQWAYKSLFFFRHDHLFLHSMLLPRVKEFVQKDATRKLTWKLSYLWMSLIFTRHCSLFLRCLAARNFPKLSQATNLKQRQFSPCPTEFRFRGRN